MNRRGAWAVHVWDDVLEFEGEAAVSVNRLSRIALAVVGFVAGLMWFSPYHQAKYEGGRTTTHTRFGMEQSPWLVFDTEYDGNRANGSFRRNVDFTVTSWSWAALAVSIAAFWVRRRFTSAEPEASEKPRSAGEAAEEAGRA